MYLEGGGEGDYGRGGKGKDRQPVPRAKLFCLRFCGRIGFVARFTLTLDKHLFSVFGLEDDGGRGGRKCPGKTIIPHRLEDQEKSYYIRYYAQGGRRRSTGWMMMFWMSEAR